MLNLNEKVKHSLEKYISNDVYNNACEWFIE